MTADESGRILAVAEEAARAAGAVIRRGLRDEADETKVEYKGAVNPVTDVDREAEAVILYHLRSRFPDHSVLAEESGGTQRSAGFQWFVDPLDGTTNFSHRDPHLAVSLACLLDGQVEVGVIYDPGRDELFSAARGGGATLNGRAISVSRTDRLERCLLATGFPYDRQERSQFYVPIFEAFMRRSQGIRRMGAAALDLAWVACGRLDGFWEPGLNPWDVDAGGLLVEEAGGRISSYSGDPLDIFSPTRIVASNGRIHDDLLEVLSRFRSLWKE